MDAHDKQKQTEMKTKSMNIKTTEGEHALKCTDKEDRDEGESALWKNISAITTTVIKWASYTLDYGNSSWTSKEVQ